MISEEHVVGTQHLTNSEMNIIILLYTQSEYKITLQLHSRPCEKLPR